MSLIDEMISEKKDLCAGSSSSSYADDPKEGKNDNEIMREEHVTVNTKVTDSSVVDRLKSTRREDPRVEQRHDSMSMPIGNCGLG